MSVLSPNECEVCEGRGWHDDFEYVDGGAVSHVTPDCRLCDGTGIHPTPERQAEIDDAIAEEQGE